jgi:hypothetical protein
VTREPDRVVRQWHDLREMLIRQLDMFETGALTLRSNGADIAPAAVHDLKQRILEFDALISEELERSAESSP